MPPPCQDGVDPPSPRGRLTRLRGSDKLRRSRQPRAERPENAFEVNYMNRLSKTVLLLAVVLTAGYVTLAPALADDDGEARKAKILANLKLAYPQLEQLNPTMGEIKPSGFGGLDEGSFTMPGRGTQKFLVSSDDTKLYLIGDPIDVSKSAEEIAAELAKRAEAEAKKAAEMRKQLDEAISGGTVPVRGNPDASVTIVEFSDFQCPYCARGTQTMDQLLEKYPEDVKLVFKHFPLSFHPWAKPAAIAAHCAGLQKPEAFWTLHDNYFAKQKEITPQNVIEKTKEFLAGTGIDMEAWSECAENKESEAYKAAAAVVDGDMALGQKLGVSGTPGFFVNGEFVNGAQPLSAFEPLIAKAKQAGS